MKRFLGSFSIMIFTASTVWGDACDDALDKAQADVQRKSDSSQARISSTGANPQQNPQSQMSTASSNPAQAMMQMMMLQAQNNQKLAELEQKRLQEYRQIANEEFKQTMELEDKIHDFRKKDYDRRKAIQEAEMKKKEEDAKITIKCNEEADTRYKALLDGNNAKSAKSTFQTNTLGRAKGTRRRMTSERSRFYAECIAKPATQLAYKLNAELLAMKMRNFNIESQQLVSDINYYESKFPKLKAQMDLNRGYVDQSGAIARSALEQQAQMQQQAMMMMMLSSVGSGAPGGAQVAANYNSARTVLDDFERIRAVCKNRGSNEVVTASADMMAYFNPVNRACRGGSGSNSGCVRNNNSQSTDNPGGALVSGLYEPGNNLVACFNSKD